MICIVCREGDIRPGTTSYTFESEGRKVVVNQVPAEVCDRCGEAFLSDLVAGDLLAIAAQARRSSESLLIRDYVTAA